MDVATLLQTSANGYMAARMATSVGTDLVRRLPYPAVGAALILGALAGVMLGRRRLGARR